jgi:hypothetical protein
VTRNERFLVVGQGAVLLGSTTAAVLLSKTEDWRPFSLVLMLLVLAVVSEQFRLETKRIKVSAAFLSLVLAMTLLGRW